MDDDNVLAEIDRLRSGMLKRVYYVMYRSAIDTDRPLQLVLDHLKWLIDEEAKGTILLSGGLHLRDGRQVDGLTILRATGWDEAEEIAHRDPLVRAGATRLRLERIELSTGTLPVSITISNSSVQLG